VLCSVGWYCLWFRWIGQTVMPLVWLLHAEGSTAFGHVIFGAMIARFPVYLPGGEQPAAEAPDGEQREPLPDGRGPDGELRNPLPDGRGSDGPAGDEVPPNPDLSGSGQAGDPPHLH
jgi:hypothetical protein